MQIRLHRERSLKGTSAFHFIKTKTSQRRYETELAKGECEWMHFRSGCGLCSFFLTRPFDFETPVWGLHLHFCASIFNQPIGQHAQATSNFAWFLKMRRIIIYFGRVQNHSVRCTPALVHTTSCISHYSWFFVRRRSICGRIQCAL